MDNIIELLKEDLVKKFKREIQYAKDCQIFAEEVRMCTQRHISVSTVKRFFQIVENQFKPSKYTLDTLAIYLGFTDWKDYIKRYQKKFHSKKTNGWDLLKSRTALVTRNSLHSIKARIGPTENLIERNFAVNHLKGFLDSDKTVTAFIAPDGYGKSALLYQFVENFFGNNRSNPNNDMVCLIDGGIFFHLAAQGDLFNPLYQLVEFDFKNSLCKYLKENPDVVKSRIVVLIDDVDEVFLSTEKYHLFADNLMKVVMAYFGMHFLKIVLTCKPNNMDIWNLLVRKSPILKDYWYGVDFENQTDSQQNIPLLNNRETQKILGKSCFESLNRLRFAHPEIIPLLRYPYFSSLISNGFKGDRISELKLLKDFADRTVFAIPYAENKMMLVNKLLVQTDFGLKHSARKDLLSIQDYSLKAYGELLSYGIFYEFTIDEGYHTPLKYVKFNNNFLFVYFLTINWLRRSNSTIELLKDIDRFYKDNLQLKHEILKNLIRIGFEQENVDMLKLFHQFLEDLTGEGSSVCNELLPICLEISTIIGIEMRHHDKLRQELVPFYAQSVLGQFLYFEQFIDFDSVVLFSADNMDFYLHHNHSKEAQINVSFMKFLKSFMLRDKEGCFREYRKVQNIDSTDLNNLMFAGRYFLVSVMFQACFLKRISPELWQQIIDRIDYFKNKLPSKTEQNPAIEDVVVFALNYGDCFAEVIDVVNYSNNFSDREGTTSSCYFKLSQLCFARALLHLGREDEGLEHYLHVKFDQIPQNMYCSVFIRIHLIKVEFLIYQGHHHKANELLDTILELAHMLKFDYFIQKAEILKATIEPPKVNLTATSH
ncbi:hypothetical protein [Mangrovibacterium sp.]|uniref:hypothetical protein n=1 Tax=Mangrovibacterium sp. TaxID=1961364 RepID=UPI003561A471